SVVFAYLGNGLQLFIVGSLIAWMPTFLARTYQLPTDRAAASAAVFVLLSGVGMIVCGSVTDRLCARSPGRKFSIAVALSLATGVQWLPLVCLGAAAAFALGRRHYAADVARLAHA